MSKIIGVAHPIEKKFMGRFFEEKKDVFIKPARCLKFLEPGMKFIFYQSRMETGFVGEAIIKNIRISSDPWQLVDSYENRLFLSNEEIEHYISDVEKWKEKNNKVHRRKVRIWMAIELIDIRRYEIPIKPRHFIPVGGQYIREDIQVIRE